MKIISGYQLTVTEEQREETARLSGLVAREFESGLDSRIRIQGIVDGPRFVLFTYFALKRYAPEPLARQFLDGELPRDPKTQKMVGHAKSLFLLDLVNTECVDGLHKLEEAVRADDRNKFYEDFIARAEDECEDY